MQVCWGVQTQVRTSIYDLYCNDVQQKHFVSVWSSVVLAVLAAASTHT